jgi:hypothetical protein
MSYSQQEYDMVRRQTMQIESEKRALLRFLLVVVTGLLGVAVVLLVITYQLYRRNQGAVKAAEMKAEAAEARTRQIERELREKTTQLETITNTAVKRQEQVEALKLRILSPSPSPTEVSEFARLVYDLPGHSIEVPKAPPGALFQRIYRYRTGNQTQTFVLVRGQVNGKFLIYSNLIETSAPQQ